MPTRGRLEWAARAVDCFNEQDYHDTELIIVDDADDPSFPHGVSYRNVRYVANEERKSIPAKRNQACSLAAGLVIAHWDSDDWSRHDRLSDQVRRLMECGKQMTGYHNMLFYREDTGEWGRYVGDATYALGTSLCYWRSWWESHPFNEGLGIGEDNDAVFMARNAGEFFSVDGTGMMVARVHDSNTSPKNMSDYRTIEPHMIPESFL